MARATKSLRISAVVRPSAPKPVNTVSSVVVAAPSSKAFWVRIQLFVSVDPSGAVPASSHRGRPRRRLDAAAVWHVVISGVKPSVPRSTVACVVVSPLVV